MNKKFPDHHNTQLKELLEFADWLECFVPDTGGCLRGKWVSKSQINKVINEGFELPLSTHGLNCWGEEVLNTKLFSEKGDPNGLCRPIISTLSKVIWKEKKCAQLLTYLSHHNGQSYALDPRTILKHMIEKLDKLGYKVSAAFELEFYLIDKNTILDLKNKKSAVADVAILAEYENFLRLIRKAADEQNINFDSVIVELGKNQFEFSISYSMNPLKAADDAIMMRRTIQSIAHQYGKIANFMAVPNADQPGNGMHVHVGVYDQQMNNCFGHDEKLLVDILKHQIKLLNDLMLPLISSYNGFRRIGIGGCAPKEIRWGYEDRNCLLRVPNSDHKSKRFEHRLPGADANPYLVLAAVISVIVDKMSELEQKSNHNINKVTKSVINNDPFAALSNWCRSEHVAKYFGENFQRVYGAVRQNEYEQILRQITKLEQQTWANSWN